MAALVFVVIKTVKYSGGDGQQDLPWAILIILAAGLIGGCFWRAGQALLDPSSTPKRAEPPLEETAPKDDSRS